MTSLRWLDLIDPLPRRLLLALTGGSLAVGSVLLDQIDQSVLVRDGIALGWLGGLVILWAGVRWRAQPRVRAQARRDRVAQRDRAQSRGLLVGGAVADGRGGLARLSATDPTLCVPALLEWAWLLYEAAHQGRQVPWFDVQPPLVGGDQLVSAEVMGVTRTQDRVRVGVVLTTARTGDVSTVLVELERPAGARSVDPALLSDLSRPDHADDWHLAGPPRRIPAPALPAKPRADLPSARRALEARVPLDAAQLEARVRTMASELTDGAIDRLASRCTPLGERALATPRVVAEGELQWLDIASDAAFDRIELALGGVLGKADDKAALLQRLIGGRASEATTVILDHLVRVPRGRRIGQLLRGAATEVAAAAGRSIATVTSARELPTAQLDRLRAGLERQYGRTLQLQQVVDPAVVGGLRVAIGDDVIDGTVRSKFTDLRLKLG